VRYRARTARPAVREYLAAERAYYDRWLESVRALRDELAARAIPAEESVSWSRVGHTYFTRTVPGREYEQFCRAVSPGRPAQVLLDENLLLAEDPARGGYLGLGVREISPDGRLLAYRTGSREPTTAWPGRPTRGRCSTSSPTPSTGRTRSGGTC